MNNFKSRRTFLAGGATLGAAAALPFIPLQNSHAAPGDIPSRLVIFHMPVGGWMDDWRCSENNGKLVLGKNLEALKDHTSKLVAIDKLDLMAGHHDGKNAGHPSIMNLWTGAVSAKGNMSSGGADKFGWPTGPSLDVFLAERLQFDAFQLGVENRDTRAPWQGPISFSGKDGDEASPNPSINEPGDAFDLIYGGGGGVTRDPAELAAIHARTASILDPVREDLKALLSRVPAADRLKIEEHLQRVSTLEARLNRKPPDCTAPSRAEFLKSPGIEGTTAAQLELAVAALACGQTRAVSFALGIESEGLKDVSFLPGFNSGFHATSHKESAEGRAAMHSSIDWTARQFRSLIDQLGAIPEGDGSMLDHTLVVWGSAIGLCYSHDSNDIPMLIAGGSALGLKGDRYIDAAGAPNNQVLVALCHLMGLTDVQKFGSGSSTKYPEIPQGALPGLIV
ncbi:MAG: hypothetical protein RJA70_4249 [Pseudomonadota bacterium]